MIHSFNMVYFYTIHLGTSRMDSEANIVGRAESVSTRGEGFVATFTEEMDADT